MLVESEVGVKELARECPKILIEAKSLGKACIFHWNWTKLTYCIGKQNIVWPGLNAPVIRGRELVAQQQLPEDPERLSKLYKMRDTMGVFKRLRIPPLERGWSGTKLPGRSIGAPDPVNGGMWLWGLRLLHYPMNFRNIWRVWHQMSWGDLSLHGHCHSHFIYLL